MNGAFFDGNNPWGFLINVFLRSRFLLMNPHRNDWLPRILALAPVVAAACLSMFVLTGCGEQQAAGPAAPPVEVVEVVVKDVPNGATAVGIPAVIRLEPNYVEAHTAASCVDDGHSHVHLDDLDELEPAYREPAMYYI